MPCSSNPSFTASLRETFNNRPEASQVNESVVLVVFPEPAHARWVTNPPPSWVLVTFWAVATVKLLVPVAVNAPLGCPALTVF